ncbi:MAG: hypothetical protein ASARMPRED_004205 [Alectoria sarmentosa]|nr:MAG: hypothetical protein ASARMPRED_004205 [Alectoria sarmentosa]
MMEDNNLEHSMAQAQATSHLNQEAYLILDPAEKSEIVDLVTTLIRNTRNVTNEGLASKLTTDEHLIIGDRKYWAWETEGNMKGDLKKVDQKDAMTKTKVALALRFGLKGRMAANNLSAAKRVKRVELGLVAGYIRDMLKKSSKKAKLQGQARMALSLKAQVGRSSQGIYIFQKDEVEGSSPSRFHKAKEHSKSYMNATLPSPEKVLCMDARTYPSRAQRDAYSTYPKPVDVGARDAKAWPPAEALLSDLLMYKIVKAGISQQERNKGWPKVFQTAGQIIITYAAPTKAPPIRSFI